MSTGSLIYTVGHSDHNTVTFIALLCRHEITLVVDVRSQPYSRWQPQFNREVPAHDLENAGITYRFMGDVLGGRPAAGGLYDPAQKHPDYQFVAQTPGYQTGIDRLLKLAQTQRAVVMCSEGDHRQCHRHLLITQTLLEQGARVLHIQPDGATAEGEPVARQLALFDASA
jgi:uncharacterized protein (DUF488 family)